MQEYLIEGLKVFRNGIHYANVINSKSNWGYVEYDIELIGYFKHGTRLTIKLKS